MTSIFGQANRGGPADQAWSNGQVLMSWRLCAVTSGTISPTFTLHHAIALDGHYDYVRLQYENDATSTTMNIDGAIVAPSAKINNFFDPVTAANVAVPWTAVTFPAGGAAGDIPAAAGGTATLAGIASASAVSNPTKAFSDWVPLTSLDRADTGETLPLLFIRTLTGAAGTFRAMRNSAIDYDLPGSWNQSANNLGRTILTAQRSGDFVTANTTLFAASPVYGDYIAPASVQYLSRGAGAIVMGMGDSLTASHSAQGNMRGYGFLACVALSRVGRPVQWQNEAYPGLTSALYYARAMAAIDVLKPRAAIIQVLSGNEANDTEATVNSAVNRAQIMAERVRRYNGRPIFSAPPPRSYGATAEGLRQGVLTRLRSAAAHGGILLIDGDAVLRDAATPNVIKSAYYVDGTHINAAGEAAMAQVATPILARALGAWSI